MTHLYTIEQRDGYTHIRHSSSVYVDVYPDGIHLSYFPSHPTIAEAEALAACLLKAVTIEQLEAEAK